MTIFFCGKKKLAITVLGISILLLNCLRTISFELAIESQPKIEVISPIVSYISYAIFISGQVFVITSFYQLGFYATFLADHFGVFIHDAPLTAFPFSVCGDPMYWGSTLSYFGLAIYNNSAAGIILTAWVGIIYKIAIAHESKMLNIIYSKKGN